MKHMKMRKVKVNLYLRLIKHHAMKTEGRVEVKLQVILTSTLALDVRECQFQVSTALSARKQPPVTTG
jgi:hypothetical protein